MEKGGHGPAPGKGVFPGSSLNCSLKSYISFAQMDHETLRSWVTTTDNLMTHDKTTFKELLARIASLGQSNISLFSRYSIAILKAKIVSIIHSQQGAGAGAEGIVA